MLRHLPGLFLLLALTLPAQGTRNHVWIWVDNSAPGPGAGSSQDPFPTIGAALAFALPHDYIIVRPGTYTESVQLPYYVFLRSESGPAATEIDATGLPGTHAVTVATLSEISGFTIRKADGGGIAVTTGRIPEYGRMIRGNRILDCPAGGITLSGSTHAAVAENVICGSSFGVHLDNRASPFFTGNTVTECGVGIEQVGPTPDSFAVFANSIIYGNATEVSGLTPSSLTHSDVGDPAFAGTNGCFDADPLWRDPATRDLRLQAGSPCLDAVNSLYVLPSSDFDNRGAGAWRRMDGDGDGIAVADIGAFERGGLDTWQTGTGVGSDLVIEVAAGVGASWWLFAAPPAPWAIPAPWAAPGTNPYVFLDTSQLQLGAAGIHGRTGVTASTFPITSPSLVGFVTMVQGLASRPGTSGLVLTSAETIRIR